MGNQVDIQKMAELERLRKSQLIEEQNFVNKLSRVCNMFKSRGFSEETSAKFTIAFYNDPVLRKKRLKRKSESEIIEDI